MNEGLPRQKLQAMILGPELDKRLPAECLFGTVDDRLRCGIGSGRWFEFEVVVGEAG